MTQGELLSLVRVLADDKKPPFRTSDPQILQFIAEAEREAAERALFLRTDAAYNVAVLSGVASYAISSDIIFIDGARLDGKPDVLIKVTQERLDFCVSGWRDKSGLPVCFVLQGTQLTLYPKPDADFTLLLDGSRRPVAAMEIPAHLHESLAYWVLYRVFSSVDADIGINSDAVAHLRSFERVFGHKRTAGFDAAWQAGKTSVPCALAGF